MKPLREVDVDYDIDSEKCRECPDKPCLSSCPVDAIHLDPDTGEVEIDRQMLWVRPLQGGLPLRCHKDEDNHGRACQGERARDKPQDLQGLRCLCLSLQDRGHTLGVIG
ncbi:polyferredoxin [Methanothermobacter thermautotrophicus str. Delta H]|uniref:Polyferredoxin n=1 Tax=Methanothermobacter thermautotrophicus (strain ATCC 29096 / DSM 1053 / JCM 10044 / NBRC 100330 / Delta H) TaxID=187420 RepID=O26500_METTH|nr:polyferredoxin [Methanothermobacter thermautotrophicus str. Delta H]